MKTDLIKILGIASTSTNNILLSHYILRQTAALKVETLVDGAGNLLIRKGESKIYPCVTAHLDTVQPYGNKDIVEEDGVLTCDTGIGGDDKVGIFLCLELLQKLPVLKVVFFAGEEHGCIGSEAVNMDWFKDVGYVIGIDRKGNSDYINEHWGKTTSAKFEFTILPILRTFKYKATVGLITDVFTLVDRNIGVSVCNLSCGYYDPHTLKESVVVKDVATTMDLLTAMITKLACERYTFVKPKIKYKQYNYLSEYKSDSTVQKCATCSKWGGCNPYFPCTGWVAIKKSKISLVCSGCHEAKRGACCIDCKSPHKKNMLITPPAETPKEVLIQCNKCKNWYPRTQIVISEAFGEVCTVCESELERGSK